YRRQTSTREPLAQAGYSVSPSPPSTPPPSNTCRLLARDRAAPEPTRALAKAVSLGRERVRPLAWCSRPRNSAALLEGALMLEQVFRDEWGRVVAGLIGLLGDFDLAEEAVQEACAIAAARWPREGTP